jgi:transglutaminase superfamily protein
MPTLFTSPKGQAFEVWTMPRQIYFVVFAMGLTVRADAQEARWWDKDVDNALMQAKNNRGELEKALNGAPRDQQPGIAFLVANMPEKDLATLKADFLLKNLDLAYQARAKMPWGKKIPEALFLNDVLPYASVTETREPWRQEMMDLCVPIVKECKTPSEAAQALNAALFTKLKVKYSTQRSRPDQSPSESIKIGMASCTGLSILLIDACRSVGVPARMVGIPKWTNKPGNHMWVEIWDGDWHFTGACEPDRNGLDRAWFVGDAALAKKDAVMNAIYASSFKRTSTNFPLVWQLKGNGIYAENVTERYTNAKQDTKSRPLSNEEKTRIFESARAYFDTGKKVDAAFDSALLVNENAVRQAAWKGYTASKIHGELKNDFEKNVVRHDKHLSPYTVKRVGKKPNGGWPIFIAMHGGGGVPKNVNDSQWEVMKKYYKDQNSVEGYVYIALRAPNDVWNGFYDDYCCPLVINLIRQFVLFSESDSNKVFLMGYSHGGYGAFFIGPKIPDRFAAVHASASAPTDGTISAKNLRNTRFTFMIGEKDTAYGRRERCEKFAAEIEQLRKDNPGDYPVAMEFQKGFGHGGLPDRDKIKDMYNHTRNPAPKRLTWDLTDAHLKDFFWLSVDNPAKGQSIDVKIDSNKATVRTEKISAFSLWLDRRLVNLAEPVNVTVNGKASSFKLTPTLATLCESIQRRGDVNLAASCKIDVSP